MNIFRLRIIAIIFLILNFFFLSNCASLQNYFINRGNDLKDIVHIGVEEDVYGASIFVDSIGLGIQHAANGKGIGMRYGNLGIYRTGGKTFIVRSKLSHSRDNLEPCPADKKCSRNYFLIFTNIYRYGNSSVSVNSSYHEPFHFSNRTKKKSVALIMIVNLGSGSKQMGVDIETDPKEDNRGNYTILPIEISIGMYLGIRLGFNFSELADFLVGFIGFDPLGDDIAGIPQPILLDKNWEDQIDNLDEIIRPIPVIEKSKFFLTKSDEVNHCYMDDVCYNYQRKESKTDQEDKCKRHGGLFIVQSKCLRINVAGFCQFPDFEKVYNYYHSIWNAKSAENDCKLLKGEFVK
jgi:hypothetical protein